MPWLVREYQDDDFEGVVRLLDATSPRQVPVFSFPGCIVALRARQAAVVAVRHGEVVGSAIAIFAADRAWVTRLAVADDLRGQGMASTRLVAALDAWGQVTPPIEDLLRTTSLRNALTYEFTSAEARFDGAQLVAARDATERVVAAVAAIMAAEDVEDAEESGGAVRDTGA
jgi:GNAT superfamily N-acetyltransferase